jgi:hypothetical protein
VHFLIYLPDATPQTLNDRMKSAGLSDLLGGHDTLPGAKGPETEIGVMVGWLQPGDRCHYQPAIQDWIPSIVKDESGKSQYWIGVYRDKPPIENELRRKYTQDGPWIDFGGQRWKVPTPDSVDSRAMLQDDGTYKWEVIREFSWMCDERQQLQDAYLKELGIRELVFRSEPSAQIGWLLKLLKINYRMTPEVANHLGLWVGKNRIMDTFLMTLGLFRKESQDG